MWSSRTSQATTDETKKEKQRVGEETSRRLPSRIHGPRITAVRASAGHNVSVGLSPLIHWPTALLPRTLQNPPPLRLRTHTSLRPFSLALEALASFAMDKDEAREYLASILNKNLRVLTTDGRLFWGTFKCTDPVCLVCPLQPQCTVAWLTDLR